MVLFCGFLSDYWNTQNVLLKAGVGDELDAYIGLWLVVPVWVFGGRRSTVGRFLGVSLLCGSNLGNWLHVLTFHNFSLVL